MQSVLLSVAAVGITAGRAQSLVALILGLISVVIAGFARGRRGPALTAVVVAATGIVLSSVRLVNSTAIGTGSGRLGAMVALAVALLGMALGGRALARARRTT